MKRTWILIVLTVLTLAACSGKASPTDTPKPTLAQPTEPAATSTSEPAPTPEPVVAEPTAPAATTDLPPAPAHAGLPLPMDRGEFFVGSGLCAVCHTNLKDASGADVSIDAFWRSTMMANASRDPYWRASFRAEVLTHPDYQAVIEDKCTTCHTPLGHFTVFVNGEKGRALDDGFFDPAHELHALALDGVSCTLCHQIQETGFGEQESYSGHYDIDTTLPAGERLTFGPFPVDEAQAIVMQGTSGFIPEEQSHVQQSELCATCHTLYTPYLNADGEIVGEFPEQTPYLEWFHSGYRERMSCQVCHMPVAEGGVILSTTGGEPRSPFHQHFFVGGNAYVLGLLQRYGKELETTASTEHFDATLARLNDQLQNRTANVVLPSVSLADGRLIAKVTVVNRTGHKFPTAYPSRRAWIHFTVRDANGQLVFESGAFDPDGAIVHNDNDAAPDSYEPHYLTIDDPEQVQIYEAIMETVEGEVTTTLLRGAGYVKDNRLLPAGFTHDNADVAVHGQATEDDDFSEGGDVIRYEVDLGDAPGPFTVKAELLYQSISYRWADNLRQHQAPEIERFLGYQAAVPNLPLVITGATATVEN